MMLIVYSTVDGHTRKICERLQQQVQACGERATLACLDDAPDPSAFDRIVIGASIRYGKHRPAVADFVRRHAALLAARKSAFFSVNIVARKPLKNRADTNPYVRKLLQPLPWQPNEVDVFAGRLDYPRYGFFDRQMIRFIMLVTHGPTDPTAVVEFTDWARVDEFALRVARM